MTPDLAALVELLGVASFPGQYVPTMALKVEELRALLAAARCLLQIQQRCERETGHRFDSDGECYYCWSQPKGTSADG